MDNSDYSGVTPDTVRVGDIRTCTKFVLCKRIGDETRWFSTVSWEEIAVKEHDLHSNAPYIGWKPVQFVSESSKSVDYLI